MSEQEHNEAVLGRGRHIGKSQTALREIGGRGWDRWAMAFLCELELSLFEMELKKQRGTWCSLGSGHCLVGGSGNIRGNKVLSSDGFH